MCTRLAIISLFVAPVLAQAAEEERRIFTIRVDGKPAGSHSIIIQKRDDGTLVMSAQAEVTVKIAIITYRYSFRGSETWKDDKLIGMTSGTNDDGKKHSVTIEPARDGLTVRADGREFIVRGQPWLTTYWRLPPADQRGPQITLLDADTGKLINAKLEKVGVERITLLGKPVDCAHWKLSGGVQVDLWFDGSDRLVRQESIEDGHRTILELNRFER